MCVCVVCVLCVFVFVAHVWGVSLCILMLDRGCVSCMFCWLWFVCLAADTGVQLWTDVTSLSSQATNTEEPVQIGHRCN